METQCWGEAPGWEAQAAPGEEAPAGTGKQPTGSEEATTAEGAKATR